MSIISDTTPGTIEWLAGSRHAATSPNLFPPNETPEHASPESAARRADALPLIASGVGPIRGGEKSVAQLGGEEAEWPFPAAADWLRRLVATPIRLVGDSAFLSAFESGQKSFLGSEAGFIFADAAFTFIMIALPYLIFVAGPLLLEGRPTFADTT